MWHHLDKDSVICGARMCKNQTRVTIVIMFFINFSGLKYVIIQQKKMLLRNLNIIQCLLCSSKILYNYFIHFMSLTPILHYLNEKKYCLCKAPWFSETIVSEKCVWSVPHLQLLISANLHRIFQLKKNIIFIFYYLSE